MKSAKQIVFTIAAAIAATIAGQAQTANAPAPAVSFPDKAPIEIVSHKIGVEYYPLLDRPSIMSAENGDMPMTDAEREARRNRGYKNTAAPIAPGDTRSRGRIRSYTHVIDDAQQVQVVLKNAASKPVKRVEWDFAYPRYEGGQLLSRYDVSSKVEIKPGGKKTLKYKLPPGVKKCEVVRVVSDDSQPDKVSAFEAVCGAGFHDPSLLDQRRETISIKRIEYADGSVWQRP